MTGQQKLFSNFTLTLSLTGACAAREDTRTTPSRPCARAARFVLAGDTVGRQPSMYVDSTFETKGAADDCQDQDQDQ